MKQPAFQRSFSLILAICTCLVTLGTHAQHDLNDYDPGSHVTGPKVSGKDIKGRVVVIEFWGITCPPCLDAIPHTTELAKQYGPDKLVIFANQSWSASDKNTKETWNKRAKNDMVVVTNGGKLKGYRPNGYPSVLVFDHTGKSIWEGRPGGMDRVIADAVANLPKKEEQASEQAGTQEDSAPPPIVTGLEPEFFEVEINRINAQNRGVASTLSKLRRAAQNASRQAQVDEAKAVIAAVESWVKAQQAVIDATRQSDPATAYTAAEQVVGLLRGDTLAEQAQATITEIRKDGKLFATVRATLLLRGVRAQAAAIGLDKDPSAADDKDNARPMRLIKRDLGRLIKDHTDTDAGEQAKMLWDQWGLDR
ncbi:MAG: TlpA disulfide reductase family protein [Planctomycetota bacterium]